MEPEIDLWVKRIYSPSLRQRITGRAATSSKQNQRLYRKKKTKYE